MELIPERLLLVDASTLVDACAVVTLAHFAPIADLGFWVLPVYSGNSNHPKTCCVTFSNGIRSFSVFGTDGD